MLGMVYRTVRQGLIDMAEMFRLIDTNAEVQDAPGAPALVVRRPTLAFEDVVFGYEEDRTILHGLSFEVPAGNHVAIVGPSGAGKSMIGRLLFRFYDPQAGRILIDGQDIAQVTQASLRDKIGIVPQDTVLFNDTIGYNIAYGRAGASTEQVAAAASAAAILPFIERLPDGLDTEVGERGLKLSGGEKQRVAIAPRWSSRTGSRPLPMPTAFSCSIRGGWPKAGRMATCYARAAYMPICGRASRPKATPEPARCGPHGLRANPVRLAAVL